MEDSFILFKLKPDWMPQPLILLALSHMVTDLSQGALPMLLPSLKTALDLSYTQIGLLVLVQNVTSSIIQPIFGAITDIAIALATTTTTITPMISPSAPKMRL